MNALRTGLKLLFATLAMVLALMAALWVWGGNNGSLATLLRYQQLFMPTGQTLEAREVQGSLRAGGHIGWLRWRRGELSVEAQDIRLAWTLDTLLNKQMRLNELSIAALKIDDQRSSDKVGQRAPPTDLHLPISFDVPFKLGNLNWSGATTLQASDLSGHYRFDGQTHTLDEGHALIASGDYRLSGQLQASAPMALAIQADGTLQTRLPSSPQPWTIEASARLTGELATPGAALTLQANLKPAPTTGPRAPPTPQGLMQARLSAQIAPWQAQPLTRAHGQWQNLNLAALWPQAPQTRLSGEAGVTPLGQAWQGQIKLANALPGPWNQQHLPLERLQAVVAYEHGQWLLQSVLATGAGGSLSGSGQIKAGQWQGQATLQGIHPGAIHTRLAGAAMSGRLQGQQSPRGITFDAQLAAAPEQGKSARTSPAPTSLNTMRLQSLQAQGLWSSPQLSLSALSIETQDAHLEGKLRYQTKTQASEGNLTLRLPGLQGTVDGRLASRDGQGALAVTITDASLASQWLMRWPMLADTLPGIKLNGTARLEAGWQGGWQQQGLGLQLVASLRAPQLAWRGKPASRQTIPAEGRLLGLELDLSGTLAALSINSKGRADTGVQQLDWQAQARGGRLEAGHWQGSLGQLKLVAQDRRQPGPWTLQTNTGTAIMLDWLTSRQEHSLTLSAGSARLQGPQPGEAALNWQGMRWSQPLAQASSQTSAKTSWHSRGQIKGLPLTWLDALNGKTMADLGLSSDLILTGAWEAEQSDALHINARLERSSGDLRLHTDDNRLDALPADMREARLDLNLDADYLSASLRWDSTRAGKALLALSTRLQPGADGLTLNPDVPIGGSLQIQLPPVDAWSVLAPPGWRLRGTMDANITLSGTLAKPEWDGQVQARDLALRSVVDGIDFSQGKLSARLHGQQMDIQDFSLMGAGTAAGPGGQLAMTGSLVLLPGASDANFLNRLAMALDIQARALRLSSRSDRRVAVSGQLTAQLKDARLGLRGKLSADQALITLPDDNAPQLGEDVVVRRAATQATTPATPARVGSTTGRTSVPRLATDLLIELDLGPDFQVRGRGLDSRLAGKLSLQAIDRELPKLTGTVRTVRGTYRAYGQRLEIEQGIVRFAGAVDNPMLNILAVRPNLNQRVGVQVSGTALSPIVRLYAEPEIPDAEKLAWLVLGRSASGSGGEAALLQQAALALLGGKGQGPSSSLTQALGLDELSIGSKTETASGAMVTIGKRLSNDFYVAYESSVTGSMGVFTIFYDLSRRLTLRAQTGEQSAVDVIWTLRYD